MLLAVALTGIAHLAFLPPIEGFDESGHFSYIQQIADQGRIPRAGVDRLSADLDAYPGPRPYWAVPPFENNGGITYKSYFAGDLPGPMMPVDRAYAPGRGLNGEAQHPPLYYLLLAPLYRLGSSWSWPALLLLLRAASWGLAFAGFAIGCRATQRQLRSFDTPAPLMSIVRTGEQMPLLYGATAKILLAYMSKADIDRIYRDTSAGKRPNRAVLDKQLARFRRQGYALTSNERVPGVTAASVPIHDADGQVRYCVSITGPCIRIDPQADELADMLLAAGKAISSQFGARIEDAEAAAVDKPGKKPPARKRSKRRVAIGAR